MTTPSIEAHDLTKHFGDLVAVDHLSLSVPPGEIFGLLDDLFQGVRVRG